MFAVVGEFMARAFAIEPRSSHAKPVEKQSALLDSESMVERLVGIVAGRVLGARGEGALIAKIDELLESGIVTSYIRPLYAAMLRDGVMSTPIPAGSLLAGERVCPEARALLDETEQLDRWIFRALSELSAEIDSGPLCDQALLDATRRPLWYLSEMPVDVAEQMLRAERFLPALLALAVSVQAPVLDVDAPTQIALARIIRDASHAMLRLLASAKPDSIPLDVVPSADRFDFSAMLEQRRREYATLLALAAQSEAQHAPVLVAPHDG